MPKDWVKVYSSSAYHKAEIAKAILEEEEIESIILNKKDSMHLHLSVGEVEIYVEQEYVMKAKHILSKVEI
jgi:hypothetical protein